MIGNRNHGHFSDTPDPEPELADLLKRTRQILQRHLKGRDSGAPLMLGDSLNFSNRAISLLTEKSARKQVDVTEVPEI